MEKEIASHRSSANGTAFEGKALYETSKGRRYSPYTYETRYGMEQQWQQLDTAQLKALYDREFQALSNDLLNGVDWRDVQQRRKRLITLTKLLYERASNNPAEYPGRTEH